MSGPKLAMVRPAQLRPAQAQRQDLTRRLAVSARHRAAIARLEAWLADCRQRSPLTVRQVRFGELAGWSFQPGSGDLVHDSGRFFAVRGIEVRTNHGHVPQWWQPIIHQPETGILGFLAKEFDGVLHLLAQVKTEPGNVNPAQLSPTVQATRSNYLRAHHGAAVPYLEYFLQRRGRVLVDVLQSEQGSWFLGKQNRNMVLEVTDDLEHDENFAWLTLGQMYELMKRPNVVNMDTRTVLACLPLSSGPGEGHAGSATPRPPENGWDVERPGPDLTGWLTSRRDHYQLSTSLVPLSRVPDWHRGPETICHRTGKYFNIIGVAVTATNREVRAWCQPLLQPCGDGLVAFVLHRGAEGLRVLAHADVRPGYRHVIEIGPTVQCTPLNFADDPERRPEFLDLVLSEDVVVHYDVTQCEEGGRFHHAITRHLIVEVAEHAAPPLPPDYFWATLTELNNRIRSGCEVNIEARSLFACIQALC
jgi:oxidase EvaA